MHFVAISRICHIRIFEHSRIRAFTHAVCFAHLCHPIRREQMRLALQRQRRRLQKSGGGSSDGGGGGLAGASTRGDKSVGVGTCSAARAEVAGLSFGPERLVPSCREAAVLRKHTRLCVCALCVFVFRVPVRTLLGWPVHANTRNSLCVCVCACVCVFLFMCARARACMCMRVCACVCGCAGV